MGQINWYHPYGGLQIMSTAALQQTPIRNVILGRMEQLPGNFTNDDRKSLYEQGAQLALLMRDFHDLRKDIRDNDSPTQSEFARLSGKVEALQNFRWYLMGIAVGAGLFTHLILSKIGL